MRKNNGCFTVFQKTNLFYESFRVAQFLQGVAISLSIHVGVDRTVVCSLHTIMPSNTLSQFDASAADDLSTVVAKIIIAHNPLHHAVAN